MYFISPTPNPILHTLTINSAVNIHMNVNLNITLRKTFHTKIPVEIVHLSHHDPSYYTL